MIDINYEISRLVNYGLQKGLIKELDKISATNGILEILGLEEYISIKVNEELQYPTEILKNILDWAAENNKLIENTVTYRDLLDTKIMAVLIPRPSEIVRKFEETKEKFGIEKATDEYYALSQASNYIRTARIAKNMQWCSETKYGNLDITVNLSKPEKDPKAIAAAKNMPQSSYPKCLLCPENVGYAGRVNHPARQNHRIIPVNLSGDQWYFQYSPYVYYNEHCIVFSENHTPMKIGEESFRRMFNFIDQFPHYFVGSNADLPIVGGSILSHDHFQGGKHEFPMAKAKSEKSYKNEKYKNVEVERINWPMSVIRIKSKDYKKLVKLGIIIFEEWKNYSDEANNIIAYTGDIRHNTITPIARKRGEYFEFDLVLRNNRTNEEYPDGIFHPHKELHHIKKENIGLIEVMGLAILPGRLKIELEEIAKILEGEKENTDLSLHKDWIEELINKYGKKLNPNKSKEVIKVEVGNIFDKVLQHAGVFKRNKIGKKGFDKFMESLGFLY